VNDKLRQDNNDSHFDRTKSHGCWICFVRISIVEYDQNGDLCVLEEMRSRSDFAILGHFLDPLHEKSA
jgi:hypothetical protein